MKGRIVWLAITWGTQGERTFWMDFGPPSVPGALNYGEMSGSDGGILLPGGDPNTAPPGLFPPPPRGLVRDDLEAHGANGHLVRLWKEHRHIRSRGEHIFRKLKKWRLMREFPCTINMLRPAVLVAAHVSNMLIRTSRPYVGFHKPAPDGWH